MNIHYQQLYPDNLELFTQLIKVFEEVFEMQDFTLPPAQHLEKVLAKEGFFVFVALHNGQVIGGLTAYTLHQYYAVAPLAYVFDLAVKTKYQRNGIGRQLMAAVVAHCKALGYEEVFVQADKADDYALDFYRATGATPEEVVHFYYPLVQKKPAAIKQA